MDDAVGPFMRKYGGTNAPQMQVYADNPSSVIGSATDWGSYIFWNLIYAIIPLTLKHWILFLFCMLFSTFVFDIWVRQVPIEEMTFRRALIHGFLWYLPITIFAHWRRFY